MTKTPAPSAITRRRKNKTHPHRRTSAPLTTRKSMKRAVVVGTMIKVTAKPHFVAAAENSIWGPGRKTVVLTHALRHPRTVCAPSAEITLRRKNKTRPHRRWKNKTRPHRRRKKNLTPATQRRVARVAGHTNTRTKISSVVQGVQNTTQGRRRPAKSGRRRRRGWWKNMMGIMFVQCAGKMKRLAKRQSCSAQVVKNTFVSDATPVR